MSDKNGSVIEKYSVTNPNFYDLANDNGAYVDDNGVNSVDSNGRYLDYLRGEDPMSNDVSFISSYHTPGQQPPVPDPSSKPSWSKKTMKCREVTLIVVGCVVLLGIAIGAAVGIIFMQQESFPITTPAPTASDTIVYSGSLRMTQPWQGSQEELKIDFMNDMKNKMNKSPLKEYFLSSAIEDYNNVTNEIMFSLTFSGMLTEYTEEPPINATTESNLHGPLIQKIIIEGETTLPINTTSIIIFDDRLSTTPAITTTTEAPLTNTTTKKPITTTFDTETTMMSNTTVETNSTTSYPPTPSTTEVTTGFIDLNSTTDSNLTTTVDTTTRSTTSEYVNLTTTESPESNRTTTTSDYVDLTTTETSESNVTTTDAMNTTSQLNKTTTDVYSTTSTSRTTLTTNDSETTTTATPSVTTLATTTTTNGSSTRCVYQDYELCREFGNKFTLLPNFFFDESIESAISTFQSYFNTTIESGCSRHVLFFLCNFVFPQCEGDDGKEVAILPCEGVCEEVTQDCKNEMPFPLSCQYPGSESNCVSPPVDVTTPAPPTCVDVNYEMCREMGFNTTVMPSLFSDTMVGTIEAFEKWGLPTVLKGCSEYSLFFYCGLFFPRCDEGNRTLPCRSVCDAISDSCRNVWEFPIDCEITTDDTNYCLLPENPPTPRTTMAPTTTTTLPPTTTLPAMRCERDKSIEICKSFGFNTTFYPNQWSLQSDEEAVTAYKDYGLYAVISGCSNNTLFYLCSVLFPPCNETGTGPKKACLDVCETVNTECTEKLFPQDCERFSDPSPDTCLKKPPQKVCPSDQFSCHASSECVPQSNVCDGYGDCTDWSDERFCECDEYQFKCNMGMCIKRFKQCDKVLDCPDGSDETDCENACPNGQFKCDSGKCIVREWVCDTQRDCPNNEDESNCPVCIDGQFKCKSGECIPESQRCDGVPNCSDHTDEQKCLVEVSKIDPFLLYFTPNMWLPVCGTSFSQELADITCKKFGNLASTNWTSVFYPYYNYAHMDPNGNITSVIGTVSIRKSCESEMAVLVQCEALGCGKRKSGDLAPSIINGQDATPGRWPWGVSLQRIGKHYCGGSLVSHNFVITAAHCVEQYKLEYSFIDLVLGATKLSVQENMQVKRKIKRLTLHNHIFHEKNDIALIQLDRPVEYTDYIQPVCLPSPTQVFTRSNRCYAIGWGMKAWNTTYSNHLQEAKMTLWDTKKCNSSLAWNGAVGDTFICAGYYSGLISTCNGDSGGALVCEDNNYNWYLVGISSYVAKGCNVSERPVVFSDAMHFAPWIKSHTQCVFKCGNGKCIFDSSQLCNREDDCGDNSDETEPCKTSVNCTFDDAFMCGYQVTEWDRIASTDFYNHYPLYDHTTGSYPGHYMVGRKRSILLKTPRFSAYDDSCLRFFYHMRGDILGGLQIWFNQFFIGDDGKEKNTWDPVFTKKNRVMADKWIMGQVPLVAGQLEVVFVTNVDSRIAIDDVRTINEPCETASCGENEVACGTGLNKQCIDKQSRCNLVVDCDDVTDEINCVDASYTCDFDHPALCGLEQSTTDYELTEWRYVNASKSPNGFKEHTTGSNLGRMLLLETNRLLEGKEVVMNQTLSLGGEAHCLQFYYFSDTRGTLQISQLNNQTNTKTVLWQIANRITPEWTKTQLDLPSVRSLNLTYTMIGGVFDGTYRPFIALDDLRVVRGSCPKFECEEGKVACQEENFCLPRTSLCNRKIDCAEGSDESSCDCTENEYKCPSGPCIDKKKTCDLEQDCFDGSDEGTICEPLKQVTCDFEHPFMCGYQVEKGDYRWERYFGPTNSHGTGPKTDHTYRNISGHYIYADGSEGRWWDTTRLYSPSFNASGKSLHFHYHIYSMFAAFNSQAGTLMVMVRDNNLEQTYTLSVLFVDDHRRWRSDCLNLPNLDNCTLILVAQRGNYTQADVAVDDVRLKDGSCRENGVTTAQTTTPAITTTTATVGSAASTCGANKKECRNGMCIDQSLWCDGFKDCVDSSDEANCPATAK